MKYLGYVEDPDLWELDVLKGGEDDLFPVVVELYRVLAVGRDHHHRALVLALEPHHQVAQKPRLGRQLGLVPPLHLLHAHLLQRDQGVILQVECAHTDPDLQHIKSEPRNKFKVFPRNKFKVFSLKL